MNKIIIILIIPMRLWQNIDSIIHIRVLLRFENLRFKPTIQIYFELLNLRKEEKKKNYVHYK
jgi:uncharacterized membrane protein